MAKVYIERIPVCIHGHALYRLDRCYGIHTAAAWCCSTVDCENYRKVLIVPHEELEVLEMGTVDNTSRGFIYPGDPMIYVKAK